MTLVTSTISFTNVIVTHELRSSRDLSVYQLGDPVYGERPDVRFVDIVLADDKALDETKRTEQKPTLNCLSVEASPPALLASMKSSELAICRANSRNADRKCRVGRNKDDIDQEVRLGLEPSEDALQVPIPARQRSTRDASSERNDKSKTKAQRGEDTKCHATKDENKR